MRDGGVVGIREAEVGQGLPEAVLLQPGLELLDEALGARGLVAAQAEDA